MVLFFIIGVDFLFCGSEVRGGGVRESLKGFFVTVWGLEGKVMKWR